MMKGTYPVEIRFKDIDLAGHVHNSVYLSYFEQARMMLFVEFVADDWDWKSKGLILARNEIDYILPVHLGDKIHISIECDHIGTKALRFPTDCFPKMTTRINLFTPRVEVFWCVWITILKKPFLFTRSGLNFLKYFKRQISVIYLCRMEYNIWFLLMETVFR